MNTKTYIIPEFIIDAKEEQQLEALTEAYQKMTAPSKTSIVLKKVSDKLPEPIKDAYGVAKEKVTESEILVAALKLVGKSFQTLEEYAAKVTLSEDEIVKKINELVPDNEITSLDEVCLARGYDISELVNKNKFADILAALLEGGALGAAGFVGLPFNLAVSTFLFYRSVQSIALFYGYDIKNNPTELQIASEVFMNATNPKGTNDSELSSTIAKIMLLSTATSVKQTVNKGWTAMAEKGGVTLLLTQMRALAHSAAKNALQKAGKNGLERTAFTEVFEQIGKKLTQRSINGSIPYIGAFIGATLDTAQMIKIINFANTFYNKRFILEKEMRINALLNQTSNIYEVEDYIEIENTDSEEPVQ